MHTFAQLVALLRSGTLSYADMTPEQWGTLTTGFTRPLGADGKPDMAATIDADALKPVEVTEVRTALGAHYRALRADEATKTSPAVRLAAAALDGVDKQSKYVASEAAKLDAADALVVDPPADPPADGGTGGGEQVPVTPGGEVVLPEVMPPGEGVTASRTAAAGAAALAKRLKAARRMPLGITAAITTGQGDAAVAEAGSPLATDKFFRDYAAACGELRQYAGQGNAVAYRAVGVVPSYRVGEADAQRLLHGDDAWKSDAKMEQMVDEQRVVDVPMGVAAAITPVFCGPVGVSFDLELTGRGGRPIYDSAVKMPSERGRFRFRPTIFVRRTQTTPPYTEWDPDTNTPDCSTFTCVQASCVNTEREVRLRLFRMCFEHTNMQELTDPEGLRAITQRNLFEFDRWLEQMYMAWFMQQSLNSSTYYKWLVGATTTYGAIPDFVAMIFTILSSMGWNARYERGGYTAYIPAGLMDWLWVDEISAAFPNTTVETVKEGFRRRGVNIVEYLDDPVLGGSPLAGPAFSIATGATNGTVVGTVSVTTVNASTTLTVPNANLFAYGQGITAAGIPANTTVIDWVDATHVKLSAAATAAATVNATVAAATSAPFGAGVLGTATGAVQLPLDAVNMVRIFLAPTQGGGWAVSETGVLEIGPDRVTQAMCDIVRTITTRREAPFWRDESRPIFTIDATFLFNGARAGTVTPHS